MSTEFHDDDLSDLLSGNALPATRAVVTPPASYEPKSFTEGCPKCGGSGRYRSFGPCFACKGKGSMTFKTSSEQRAKGRATAAKRSANKALELAESIASFTSEHAAEVEWLKAAAARNANRNGTFTFPADLLSKLNQYGPLSENQIAAVRRLMLKDELRRADRQAEREAGAKTVDVAVIEKAFAVAREKAVVAGQIGTFVKPLKLKAGDVSIKVSPGSIGSQWEGMLFVKAVEDDRKLGYVKGGRFFKQFSCTAVEEEAVLACASAPKEALIAYAQAWSQCGVCNRMLLKKESIERGIGPICFAKYGW